jgi:hypothetical protein
VPWDSLSSPKGHKLSPPLSKGWHQGVERESWRGFKARERYWGEWELGASISENMDRGLIHKSSPLVGEMGEGHGWWSVNNLRPPFEQHNSCVLVPSTTTASSSSSHINSFSSLLLSNHYPLPTTSTATWHDSSSSNQGQQLQDPWSHLVMYVSLSLSLFPFVCDHSAVNWRLNTLSTIFFSSSDVIVLN